MKIKTRRLVRDLLISLAALFLGLIMVFPVFYTIATAFKTRAELSVFPPRVLPARFLNLENFKMVFHTAPLLRYMLNSLIVSGMGCFLKIIFAVLASYAFSYFSFPGKSILFVIVLGTMMLPADTLVVSNYLTITRLNMLDNYFAMAVTSLIGASQMFMLRQNFRTIPRAYRDAAFIDGCGDFRYLFYIIIPYSGPVILILMVQSFITFWNAYLWPLLVTNRTEMRTVQVGIAMLTNPMDTNYTLVLAAVTLLFIPSFILFGFFRATMGRGIDAGALAG